MDRRRFLTRSGVGAAALAVAGIGEAAGVEAADRRRDLARHEGQDYGGDGRGAGQVWWSLETTEKVAALTFDDGPHRELTPRVLRALAQRGVRATFFMIGHNAVDHPQIVSAVVSAGHEVGNHTWEHVRLARAAPDTVRHDVAEGARALHRVTGVGTRWFRPPRGMVTGDVLLAASAIGQPVVLWSVTRGHGADSDAGAVERHLIDNLHPGAIIDLHDGTGRRPEARLLTRRRAELEVLPAFLDRAIAAGYRFRTVSELLGRSPAPQGGGPSTR